MCKAVYKVTKNDDVFGHTILLVQETHRLTFDSSNQFNFFLS